MRYTSNANELNNECYLFQTTYTREAIAAMVHNPQDRAQAVRAVIEKPGGRVEGF
jgi:hypothetical protein